MPNGTPHTDRVRRRFQSSQRVHARPDAVFPLLCPVREYDWIPGWDCRLVYSESGFAEPGCIFQTDREADGGLDTWVVSHYDPGHHIAFVRVNALRVMQYEIRLEPLNERETRLTWTQSITSLNEQGDRLVRENREADFAQSIAKLEGLMNDYLASPG